MTQKLIITLLALLIVLPPLLYGAWFLISPALFDQAVDEEFPEVSQATIVPTPETLESTEEPLPTEIPLPTSTETATPLPSSTETMPPLPTATEIATVAPTPTPTIDLPDLGEAPEISHNVWINSDHPLRLADLRGQVILLDFWTYGCYNCQNVLPSLKKWHKMYSGDDFKIVSIHYPEFTYERDYNNVLDAVVRFGVEYPVAIDNDGTTWRAYKQRYWPTWYVLDKEGHIRYKHIGEGGYQETEEVIEALLAQPYSGS